MIILFGLAGSGKGTQGKALSEIFGWRTLSVGEVIRSSEQYSDVINQGYLIPDTDVINLMNQQIERAEAEGFDVILDGYPRSVVQAEWLVQHLASKVYGAIIIEVPKGELYQRLELRARDDDKSREAIDRRWEIFEQNISGILPVLESHGIPIARVNGVGEVGTVTGRLIAAVEQMYPVATKQKQDVNGGEIEQSYGE